MQTKPKEQKNQHFRTFSDFSSKNFCSFKYIRLYDAFSMQISICHKNVFSSAWLQWYFVVFIINVRTTHVIRKHGEFKRVVNITQTPKMVEFFSIKSGATRFSRKESSHRIRCFIGGLKKSQWNTDEKVGLLQVDVLKF